MKMSTLINNLQIVPTIFFIFSNNSSAIAAKLPPIRQGHQLSQETRENLLKAMHGEAFANAKYLLYAQHARKEGKEDLAKIFEDTAQMERLEHFRELAELHGLVGPSKENLKAAIEGEVYEATKMYIEFAQKAEMAGDYEVSARFREIAKDESIHAQTYKQQLKKLTN